MAYHTYLAGLPRSACPLEPNELQYQTGLAEAVWRLVEPPGGHLLVVYK